MSASYLFTNVDITATQKIKAIMIRTLLTYDVARLKAGYSNQKYTNAIIKTTIPKPITVLLSGRQC